MMDPDSPTRVSESRPDPFVGMTFDGYRIEEVIGRGGMGTVYKATQLSLARPVAIKVLPPELAEDQQFLDRFHREADVLSKLSHPNIVTVFDRGEVDGRPYLAMEYIEGTNLRNLMREGPLAPAEALRIVSLVLAALEHAHENGIVHRDIKPENVLLARGNIVKVADFGLSRLLGGVDSTRLTRTHLVLGTFEYMAPEQRERAREADARSDLYATGVVLYEMLVGELPIGRFELPSQRRPDACDRRIDGLIERSLEKNPDRRYQCAEEMSSAVSCILERPDARPADAPPPSPATTTTTTTTGSGVYRPIRFEYHLDNLATIDHVLGTVCYILGVFSIFGAGFTRSLFVGMPFWVLFILGWYLRTTADDLRKYRTKARTAQAVIGILATFTGILIPFSIYSFWVLYGHRGRTYYEARSRGLDEQEAARYTYRLMEEPYADRSAPPPAPATSPTPSQIPVQSVVTSEVVGRPRGPAQRSAPPLPPSPAGPRLSPWVGVGTVFFFLLVAAALLLPAAGGTGFGMAMVAPAVGITFLLLVIGFFHALFSPRVKGAGLAFLLLCLGGLASVWLSAGVESSLDSRWWSSHESARPGEAPVQATPAAAEFRWRTWRKCRVAQLTRQPPPDAVSDFFWPGRLEWISRNSGIPVSDLRGIRLVRGEAGGADVLSVHLCALELNDRQRSELWFLVHRLVRTAPEFQINQSLAFGMPAGTVPPPGEWQESMRRDPVPVR